MYVLACELVACPHRSSRAHGKRALLMHFPGKSGDLCPKLSDRIWKYISMIVRSLGIDGHVASTRVCAKQ